VAIVVEEGSEKECKCPTGREPMLKSRKMNEMANKSNTSEN